MEFIFIILTLKIILLRCSGNISCLQFRRADILECSQSLESVKEGLGCPVNKSEWETRAQAMQCEMYSQNCTDKSFFVYHCLINPWSNGTIEVCAPRVKILGKRCAEFNIGGMRVQSHYKTACQLCPHRYNSSESYKYQECYKLAEIPELTTKQASSSKEPSYNTVGGKPKHVSNSRNQTQKPGFGNEKQNTLIIVLTLACVIILIALCLIFRTIGRRTTKARGDKQSTEPEIENGLLNVEVNTPCLKGNTNHTENKTEETTINGIDEEKPSSSEVSMDTGVIQNPLHMNTDFLKDLCKVESCEGGMDGLKEKIIKSPYFNIYNVYMSRTSYQGMSVTGNWREDIGIKAAAVIFNMKIYVFQKHEDKTTIFFPKDPVTSKWMKIAVDREGHYNLLSDCNTCNEEEAKLVFDVEYEIPGEYFTDQEGKHGVKNFINFSQKDHLSHCVLCCIYIYFHIWNIWVQSQGILRMDMMYKSAFFKILKFVAPGLGDLEVGKGALFNIYNISLKKDVFIKSSTIIG